MLRSLTIDADLAGAPVAERWHLQLARDGGDLLVSIDAPFFDDPPPPGPPGVTDGLWEHEVVELFVVGQGGYLEVELGPHGHQLTLRLTGVRQAAEERPELAYAARIDGGRWAGEARIPAALLPAGPHRLNAFAIHGRPRRYLAWAAMPGSVPDFHQPERFPAVVLP